MTSETVRKGQKLETVRPEVVVTCETDLQSLKLEIVATGETDVQGHNMEVVVTGETALQGEMMEFVVAGEADLQGKKLARLICKFVRKLRDVLCQRGRSFGSGSACCGGRRNVALRRSC